MKVVESRPAICYSYDYITSVCVLVKYVENFDANQAAWEYVGGCFEDGLAVEYKPADP